jgi:hypothetical protein
MLRTRPRSARLVALAAGLALAWAGGASAYPIDGYQYTGLFRLEATRLVQLGKATGVKRAPGELLPLEKVQLRLLDHPDLQLPAPDPALTAAVKGMLGGAASRYGIALLDLSDVSRPRYAEWQGEQQQNPGSVGKVLVALAVFQALADAHPNDIAARERVLRETIITADVFSVYDHHTVPKLDPKTNRVFRAPIQQGDRGSLWTYLDWMMSPSSNSAAGMVQKQLILMKQFGTAYPPSPEQEKQFFDETSAKVLGDLFAQAIQGPVARNGLGLNALRQGSFFTHEGKKRVPGPTSYATARELLRYMLLMEQGRLVDPWSSREIKRLMYITERRIRYASAPILRDSAVYFKSGSLYSCMPEPGFVCKKYHGNKRNYMNSAAIVETPAGQDQLYYMTAVLSNVLRKNSAADHQELARAIHVRLLADHPDRKPDTARFGEDLIGYAEERRAVALKLETQQALLDLGYQIGAVDGLIGANTRAAVRAFQKQQGLPVTGEPSEELLERLREAAQQNESAQD